MPQVAWRALSRRCEGAEQKVQDLIAKVRRYVTDGNREADAAAEHAANTVLACMVVPPLATSGPTLEEAEKSIKDNIARTAVPPSGAGDKGDLAPLLFPCGKNSGNYCPRGTCAQCGAAVDFHVGPAVPKSPSAPLPPVPPLTPEDADALLGALVRDVTVQVMRETMSAYVDGILPPKDSPESPSVTKSKSALRARILPAPAPTPKREVCEGFSARWCHNCGTCECSGAAWMQGDYAATCPLHGSKSEHADDDPLHAVPPALDVDALLLMIKAKDLEIRRLQSAVEYALANAEPAWLIPETPAHLLKPKRDAANAFRQMMRDALNPSSLPPVVPPESQDVEALLKALEDAAVRFDQVDGGHRVQNYQAEALKLDIARNALRSALSRPTGGAK